MRRKFTMRSGIFRMSSERFSRSMVLNSTSDTCGIEAGIGRAFSPLLSRWAVHRDPHHAGIGRAVGALAATRTREWSLSWAKAMKFSNTSTSGKRVRQDDFAGVKAGAFIGNMGTSLTRQRLFDCLAKNV